MRKSIKRNLNDKIAFAVVFAIFAFYSATLIFAFLWAIMTSFKDKFDYVISGNQEEVLRMVKKL